MKTKTLKLSIILNWPLTFEDRFLAQSSMLFPSVFSNTVVCLAKATLPWLVRHLKVQIITSTALKNGKSGSMIILLQVPNAT